MYTYSFAGRSRRSAVTCAILALVAISVAVPSGAFPSTGKIIDLRTKKHYILSIDGTFSLTSGEAVESGTLNAPKTVFTRVPLGKSSARIGKGIGRVTNLLTHPWYRVPTRRGHHLEHVRIWPGTQCTRIDHPG